MDVSVWNAETERQRKLEEILKIRAENNADNSGESQHEDADDKEIVDAGSDVDEGYSSVDCRVNSLNQTLF